MMRTVVIVGTLLLGVGAVMAQEDALKHAQNFMKGNGKNAGALGAMVKGEKPYDQATVNTALAQFEDTAKNLPTLFPDSLKGAKWGGRLQRFSEDLGRQGWFQRAHHKLRQDRSGRQGQDHGSRFAEGDVACHRQAMRRLSRDLPRQEQLKGEAKGAGA